MSKTASGLSVGEAFPMQQARIRECLQNGREIGPAGAFYCMVAEDLLRRADAAAMSGDITLILSVYQEMLEFKE